MKQDSNKKFNQDDCEIIELNLFKAATEMAM